MDRSGKVGISSLWPAVTLQCVSIFVELMVGETSLITEDFLPSPYIRDRSAAENNVVSLGK